MEDAIDPQEWDAQGKPIQASSGGAQEWDASGKPIAVTQVADSDTRNSIQKSFDENTKTSPNESLLETGLKSVVHGVGQAFVHPWDTAVAVAKSIPHMSATDPENPIAQMGAATAQDYQDAGGGKHGAAYAGTKLAGNTFGNVAVGEAAGPAFSLASDAAKATGLTDAASSALTTAKTAAGKLVPSLVDGPPESLMTRAIKPGKNNTNWLPDVQKAAPLMKSAEQQLGHPIQGVDDALDAASIAKKDIWQQYQARLGPAAQQGAAIDGNEIADAMLKSIDKRTAIQNPALAQKVQQIADTYRRPLWLNEAEDFLQSANKDLNTYYTKNKVGQQVAMNDPEISSTVAEAQVLRNALYSKLDQLTGPGSAQLKQAYGSLTNVEKELYGRQLVAARQAPESLSEQLSTVAGAGKIAKGVFTASPGDVLEGVQNIAVSRALKARNSSDAMIERAFQAAQPAQPFPMPSSPRIAGLLERGPIQMSAPPEVGGTPAGYQPPPFYADTDQMRLGRLLPARSSAPSIPPYVPGMSAGERSAALNQWLRQRQQLSLPANASAIQLPPPR